ncbi:hypothetical protein KAH43_07025 [Candidatus Bipolaricaulota bacterium]|nr:hypothetical protein [Candidatus Bipolaricaulota bacterium]
MPLKRSARRAIIAVSFGVVGFAVNFLDIELFASPQFKVSILLGLLFPLLITLAWGWRYGVLSALAGGCQSMWWLWQMDGYGIFYAVPVFTLWILWHGYWAARRGRQDQPRWYLSVFAVEIPFRIVSELGFYTIFRYLVSFNPPPWSPSIIWDHVPLSWVNTVALKHVISGYLLLMIAHILLNLSPVRRFFGLKKQSTEQMSGVIYFVALLSGALLFFVRTVAEYLILDSQGQTFWDVTVLNASPHTLLMWNLDVLIFVIIGIVVARLITKRMQAQERTEHLVLALRSICDVNQFIAKERDREKLIQGSCESLVNTSGYRNAWIVLIDESRHFVTHHAEAGLGKRFLPLLEDIKYAKFSSCWKKALAQQQVVVTQTPMITCVNCPLSSSYGGMSALTIQLSYDGNTYGILSASVSPEVITHAEELALFNEVATDIGFALYSINQEEKRVQAEREKQAAEAHLRQSQKLESIGTLASGVAHEINNPLMGMMNYAELVKDKAQDAKSIEYLTEIGNEGNRIAKIVRNLLSFSRQDKEEHSPARIADIIDSSLTLVGSTLRRDQITVDLDIPEDLPQLKCRNQQIQQVLINLLTNSRDALNARYPEYDENKLVRITARTFEQDGEDWIRTTVEDHGTGMAQDVAQRIFDPFFTTKSRTEGTGLGLSVSFGIVKEHHGKLTVESVPGEYARFHIDLRVNNGWSHKQRQERDVSLGGSR